MSKTDETSSTNRTGTVLGWLAGALALLLVNFFAYHAYGEGYPVEPTSFVAVVAGAFAGMAIADRLGARATKVLGLAVGFLLAAGTITAFIVLGSGHT